MFWYSSENPFAENEAYRMEVLVALERLTKLDKEEFTEEEKEEAKGIRAERGPDEVEIISC